MKTKCLLLSLICLAVGGSLFAQGIPYQLSPAPNARVLFCPVPDGGYPCPTQTTVFSDSAATQVVAQPISVGSSGNLSVYFAAGTTQFTLQLTGQGYGPTNRTVVTLGGGSGVGSGVFSFINYGAVDDDSTDNCANGAVAAFTTAVNAYSGPGTPVAIIGEGGSNKAYKLATASNSCAFQFTNPKGVTVHLWANIDCAQTAQYCIGLGPTNTAGLAAAYPAQGSFRLDGGGTLLGGANLTNVPAGQTSSAGVYVEPQVTNFYIDGIRFMGAGSNFGFGATNATLGNCTNYAIFIDYPVADGTVENSYIATAATDSTHGGCGIGNPNGFVAGTNTVAFTHNVLGTTGFVGGVGNCGSIGIVDGGSLGTMLDNLIYGYGMDVRLQGLGHRFVANELDAANCSAKGVSAIVHIGGNGSSTPVSQVMISNNIVQVGTGHTTNFLAIAGDSTATLSDWTITGNITNSSGSGPLIAGTPNCAQHQTTTGCYVAGNQNFNNLPGPSSAQTGWSLSDTFVGFKGVAAQSANVGSTLVINVPETRTYRVYCSVITHNTPTGATLPACNLSFTDLNSGATATPALTATTSTSAAGVMTNGFALATITSGGALNFTSTGYAAGSGTALTYDLNIFVYAY